MKCLNCSREIDKSFFPEDLIYCPYCGEEIGSVSIGVKLQFCPYCGKKLTAQTSFCPHCGKKLSSIESKNGMPGIHNLKDIQQAGKDFIDNTKHKVIISSHPSGQSYYNKLENYPSFNKIDHMGITNKYLKKHNKNTIQWDIL